MASDFTPRYPDDTPEEEVFIPFTQSEFYDVIYAAREAQIRFKRLRTQLRNEPLNEYNEWKIDDCTDSINHYKSMEQWLKNKYHLAYNEHW